MNNNEIDSCTGFCTVVLGMVIVGIKSPNP